MSNVIDLLKFKGKKEAAKSSVPAIKKILGNDNYSDLINSMFKGENQEAITESMGLKNVIGEWTIRNPKPWHITKAAAQAGGKPSEFITMQARLGRKNLYPQAFRMDHAGNISRVPSGHESPMFESLKDAWDKHKNKPHTFWADGSID